MRCFIGVMLPEEIKEKIKDLQNQIRKFTNQLQVC
jgi:2'-5' RNA ligase